MPRRPSWKSSAAILSGTRLCASAFLLLLLAHPAQTAWSPNGVTVSTAPGRQIEPAVCRDGGDGSFIAWTDFRSGSPHIYLQHLTSAGTVAPGWPSNGIAVCTAPGSREYPRVVPDGSGGVLVAWMDTRGVTLSKHRALYVQRIGSSGSIFPGWPNDGVALATADRAEWFSDAVLPRPVFAPDGVGGLYAVWNITGYWQECGGCQYTPLWNRIVFGQLTGSGTPVVSFTDMCCLNRKHATVVADGLGGAVVGLEVVDAVSVQRWSAETLSWDTPLPQLSGRVNESAPALVPDGSGGAIATQSFTWPHYKILAQRIGANGNAAPGWDPAVHVAPPSDTEPRNHLGAVEDGAGGIVILWNDYQHIYATRLLDDGAQAWPAGAAPLFDFAPGTEYSGAVPDGQGGAYVAWQDSVDYPESSDIFMARVASNGRRSPEWPGEGRRVCLAEGAQLAPSMTADGSGGAVVAWSDGRDGTEYDIYAQHVDIEEDFPTPSLAWLARTEVEPDRVVLTWFIGSVTPGTTRVYRRSEGAAWTVLGAPRNQGSGQVVFEDRSVTKGRYAYRLGYEGGSGEEFTREEWLSVPGPHLLALAGFQPNPAAGAPIVSFSLSDARPARLEVLDLSGRAIVVREVGSLGPGQHVMRLGRDRHMVPGMYWVRLVQAGRSLVVKGVIAP